MNATTPTIEPRPDGTLVVRYTDPTTGLPVTIPIPPDISGPDWALAAKLAA